MLQVSTRNGERVTRCFVEDGKEAALSGLRERGAGVGVAKL